MLSREYSPPHGISDPESSTIAVDSDLQDYELAYSESTYSSTAAIYLFPPSDLPHATVQVALTPSWSLSAVYPLPQDTAIQSGDDPTATQSLTWAVKAEVGGMLKEKTTGTNVSYLYWAADVTGPDLPLLPSRPTSPVVYEVGAFDPSRPSTSRYDSILLPKGEVPGYLDTVLKLLTLRTEARTSFITYWLPKLNKHEFVALRFIPQKLCEKAAQMSISPIPDVVTRVFMLFHCVPSNKAADWGYAAGAISVDKTDWKKVVGIDLARASDPALFHVLELGGMEVGWC